MKKSNHKQSAEDVEEIEPEYAGVDINPLIFDYMVKKTFNMFDEDGSGDIDRGEFSKLTDVLGLQISEKKQQELLRELDKEGSGAIDFDEFLNLMSKFQMGDIRKQLEGTFCDYDKDMDNVINLSDIMRVSEELDETQISEDDAKLIIAFFKYFCKDKATKLNGITKDEFLLALNKMNFLIDKDENSDILADFINKSRNSIIVDANKSLNNRAKSQFNPGKNNESKISKGTEKDKGKDKKEEKK